MDYKHLTDIEFDGIDHKDAPDYVDLFISEAKFNGEYLSEKELEEIPFEVVYDLFMKHLH